MFLKNKNIIFKIRRSKLTDYAALNMFDGINILISDVDKETHSVWFVLKILNLSMYHLLVHTNRGIKFEV